MRMLRHHVLTVIGKDHHQRSQWSESQRGGGVLELKGDKKNLHAIG
jgi:hypothetical protein